MRRLTRIALIGGAALATASAPSSSAAPAPERSQTVTVKVVDFEFRKDEVALSRGGRIDFRWSPSNISPHNVTLREGPKGVRVRDFRSETGRTKVSFEPTFERPGRYRFKCTIHPDLMRLEVEVGR